MKMEENLITEKIVCSFCKSKIEEKVIYCTNCGHPENGTDKERAQFFAKRAMEKSKNIDASEKIKSAKNTLFILAGLMVLSGFISYSSSNSILELSINFFVAFIYLFLAFLAEKKPFASLLTGLFLYITLISLSAIIEPMTLVKGIIFKILIISYLGKGLYSAYELKKEHNNSLVSDKM